MIIKILGSVTVILASSFAGFILARDSARRPQELRVLQSLLQMLENEIVFLSSILEEAFEKIGRLSYVPCSEIFKSAAYSLREGKSAMSAWESAVRKNIKRTALNKEDEEILISLGRLLGSSDIEGQVKNLRLTVNQLEMQEQKAEELRNKNEKMYKSLGILCGLAIVIILM